MLTHLVALVTPTLGTGGAARAVSTTTAAAVIAVGPSLVGVLRDWAGTDGLALGACMALQAVAAATILLGPGRAPATR